MLFRGLGVGEDRDKLTGPVTVPPRIRGEGGFNQLIDSLMT